MGCGATPAPRHLILVTVDTLRPDRLGVYGARAAETPNVDGLARSGLRFERAFAHASSTLPSISSLLTGLRPAEHRRLTNIGSLRRDVPTLATRLRAEGFDTAGFVGSFVLRPEQGTARGFGRTPAATACTRTAATTRRTGRPVSPTTRSRGSTHARGIRACSSGSTTRSRTVPTRRRATASPCRGGRCCLGARRSRGFARSPATSGSATVGCASTRPATTARFARWTASSVGCSTPCASAICCVTVSSCSLRTTPRPSVRRHSTVRTDRGCRRRCSACRCCCGRPASSRRSAAMWCG